MKKAMVYGAGLSGMGAVRLLGETGYEVILVDDKKAMTSEEAMRNLEGVEVFIKSPGIPYTDLVAEVKKRKIELIDELELAYRELGKLENRPRIIAVTGTNGKTTVTTKIKEMLEFSGKDSEYAGNIGSSFAELVCDMKSGRSLEYIVLEMSSYQLENLRDFKADISMVINLAPDHLDRYKGAKEYFDTKLNIAMNQVEAGDHFILNLDCQEIVNRLSRILANRYTVSARNAAGDIHVKDGWIVKGSERLLDISRLSLKGEHNLENQLFIAAVADIEGISFDKVREFLYKTNSLEHRMEEFYRAGEVLFVNDSKGTNIESTLMAVRAYEKPTVICGGSDKKLDLMPLAEGLRDGAGEVYLIGEIADQLEKCLLEAGLAPENIKNERTLSRVVERIKSEIDIKQERVVLLSPATASFDQFANYMERGRSFKELIIECFKKGE